MTAQGEIYFIQQQYTGNVEEDPIKIGWSKLARFRFDVLQTGSPFPLKMLVALPGSQEMERGIHRLLAPHKIGREWFKPCEEISRIVETSQIPPLPPKEPRLPKKKGKSVRLALVSKTDEERQLLEDVKVAAIRHHMRLKEFIVSKLREALGSEREGTLPDKPKKK